MENMNVCQSCGMPLTSEELKGTNKDQSVSEEYCTYCYQNGSFGKPDETLEKMIETCVPFMVQDNPDLTSEAAEAQLRAFLPTLKRWK